MALATAQDVTNRLEEEPTERMLAMIGEYLEDASDVARYHGLGTWNELTVPNAVRRLVASAVARFMRNPDNFAQNRAGDETVGWHDRGDIDWFTQQELDRIARMATPTSLPGFGTIQMQAGTNGHWRDRGDAEYVSPAGGGKPFPFFTSSGW